MKYAVISLRGKQFKISEGDRLKVDSVGLEEGKTLSADSVLLFADGDKVTVGTPAVAGAKVALKVAGQDIDKTQVRRFRSKSRHRRNYGHKQPKSILTVEKIELGKEKAK